MAEPAIDYKHDMWEHLIRESRHDPCTFMETTMKDQKGVPLLMSHIHEEFHRFIRENQFGIIEFPREHGKTTNMIGSIASSIGNNPNRRIKIVSSTDGLATAKCKATRELIESPIYQSIFPHIKKGREWGESSFSVQRSIITPEPTLEACGVMSKGTGGRCDDLFLDDVDDEEVVTSEQKRKRIQERVTNVWLNLLPPGRTGKSFALATPWHEGDTSGMLKELGWPVIRFPVVNMKPVWVERWGVKNLLARKKQAGFLSFARGFELVPMSAEASPIDGAWFGLWYSLPELVYLGIAVDPANSIKPGSDYTAIGVLGLGRNNDVYLLELIRKRFTFPDLLDKIKSVAEQAKKRYELTPTIGIEDVAFQNAIPQSLKRSSRFPIIGLKADKSKFNRASRLAVHVDNGRVNLKGGEDSYVHPEQRIVYDECTIYPSAAHDDCLDMLGYGVKMLLEDARAGVRITHLN